VHYCYRERCAQPHVRDVELQLHAGLAPPYEAQAGADELRGEKRGGAAQEQTQDDRDLAESERMSVLAQFEVNYIALGDEEDRRE
jgi:hypothetical protein